jgi:hypothetical protein
MDIELGKLDLIPLVGAIKIKIAQASRLHTCPFKVKF